MATASRFTQVTVISSMSVDEARSLEKVLQYVEGHNEIFIKTVYEDSMSILKSLQEVPNGASIAR